MKKATLLVVLSYALVYLVWGSTYFFIKASVASIPASFVVAWRFLAGAIILTGLGIARKGFSPFPTLKEIAGSLAIGILLLLMGNGLITAAERTIPSWMGSIVIACMPIYVAIYNFILYRTHITPIRLIGAAAGVLGVIIILYDGSSLASSLNPGALLAVAGALSWGFGTSVAKALPKAKDVFASTAIQMYGAAAVSLAIGIAGGGNPVRALFSATPWSLFSLAYLAVLGSLTLVAYNYLLVVEPSFRISSYSLVNPVIAVFLGLVSGEAAAPFLAFGLPPVLLGLTLMLYGDALRNRFSRRGSKRKS